MGGLSQSGTRVQKEPATPTAASPGRSLLPAYLPRWSSLMLTIETNIKKQVALLLSPLSARMRRPGFHSPPVCQAFLRMDNRVATSSIGRRIAVRRRSSLTRKDGKLRARRCPRFCCAFPLELRLFPHISVSGYISQNDLPFLPSLSAVSLSQPETDGHGDAAGADVGRQALANAGALPEDADDHAILIAVHDAREDVVRVRRSADGEQDHQQQRLEVEQRRLQAWALARAREGRAEWGMHHGFRDPVRGGKRMSSGALRSGAQSGQMERCSAWDIRWGACGVRTRRLCPAGTRATPGAFGPSFLHIFLM